jgi:hypothetical protein
MRDALAIIDRPKNGRNAIAAVEAGKTVRNVKNRAVYLVHVLTLILCSHESYAKIAVTRLDCRKQIAGIAVREEMALSGSIYTLGVTFLVQESSMSENQPSFARGHCRPKN